jgi:hypothetical protein
VPVESSEHWVPAFAGMTAGGVVKVTRIYPRNALRILATPGLFVRLIPVLPARVIIHPLRRHRATRDERATEQDRVVWGSPRTRRTQEDPAGEKTCTRGPAQVSTMTGVHRGG